jgi:nucleoside-diphosphate-sugar epimerase
MKKVAVVTGSFGFIGRRLCVALEDMGHIVVGLDIKYGFDIRECYLPPADVCFHLAGQSNARSHDVVEDAAHNIIGTLRVLEIYRDRVVYAASIAPPVTPYAISKLAGEHYCRLYGARIVRMCNVSGPGPAAHGVIDAFTKATTIRIAGDGGQRRSYAPVERAVDLFLQAANSPPGTELELKGVDLSVLEIAELFFPDKPREFYELDPNDVKTVVSK